MFPRVNFDSWYIAMKTWAFTAEESQYYDGMDIWGIKMKRVKLYYTATGVFVPVWHVTKSHTATQFIH